MSANKTSPATNGRKHSATGADARDGRKLDDRFDQLKERLEDAQEEREAEETADREAENRHKRAGIAQAFRLSSEFIAGVVVGAGIGYFVDTFFDTSPWGMIIFLMLGFAAAVLNVMRAAGMVAPSEMRLKPAQKLYEQQQQGETGETTEK